MSEAKKLFRARDDRVIAGVCGGIAHYFSIDSALVRVIAVILGLSGGGILAYIVAWIIIPETPGGEKEEKVKEVKIKTQGTGHNTLGLWLVILGFIFLIGNFVSWWAILQFWPLALIGLGVWFLIKNTED